MHSPGWIFWGGDGASFKSFNFHPKNRTVLWSVQLSGEIQSGFSTSICIITSGDLHTLLVSLKDIDKTIRLQAKCRNDRTLIVSDGYKTIGGE